MGFRFRKSIKLPGGFRVNASKSGIGYSWGTKGFRVTKTAKGTTRTTASIPGTGISYVQESKKQKVTRKTVQKDWADKIAPALPLIYVVWFCGIAAGTFFLLSLIFK